MNRMLTTLIAGVSILGLSGAAVANDMNKPKQPAKTQAGENRNTNPTGKDKAAPKATTKSGAAKNLPKDTKDQADENRNTNPTGKDKKDTMRMQQNKSGANTTKDPNPKQVDENRNTDPASKKKN